MKHLIKFFETGKEGLQLWAASTLIAILAFGGTFAFSAYATNPETETLTVTIDPAVTFLATTVSFGNLTPGTYKTATTTTNVVTNASAWNVTMYGNAVTGSTTLGSLANPTVGITDQTQWVPGAATTSAGNAVATASLDSTGDVLAFRVKTATGTYSFRSTSWWGTDDTIGTNAKWAGVASTTVQRKIGSVSNSYSAAAVSNDVQYYLDVPSSQLSGDYSGNIVFTWASGA